ncbi:hypothetical protein ACFJYO_15725, partial [Enterococcus faecalis]
ENFKLFSSNVLMKLGNFPSLELIGNIEEISNEEIVKDKILKSVMQKAPELNLDENDSCMQKDSLTFTDAQYSIFESLKNSNHYSFSGSTSFG